jgi:hypothetical protein
MPKTLKQHRMDYTTDVGKTAVSLTHHFLTTRWAAYTVAIHSVEEDPAYQAHDVDLLWSIVDGNGRLRTIPLEVKGDRHHQTGNFFLETVSNADRQTAGCFLYTKAHWLFYVFVEVAELYCIPHGPGPPLVRRKQRPLPRSPHQHPRRRWQLRYHRPACPHPNPARRTPRHPPLAQNRRGVGGDWRFLTQRRRECFFIFASSPLCTFALNVLCSGHTQEKVANARQGLPKQPRIRLSLSGNSYLINNIS